MTEYWRINVERVTPPEGHSWNALLQRLIVPCFPCAVCCVLLPCLAPALLAHCTAPVLQAALRGAYRLGC